MIAALLVAAALGQPPNIPVYPVVIETDKAAYSLKDHIVVTLRNNGKTPVRVDPILPVERSRGDGTWAPVYTLVTQAKCPVRPPPKWECVTIQPGESLTLAAWDWNTGGYTQCPPRRPGHRAFKGVHRITAKWCEGSAPERGADRVKLVTWE